MDRFWELLAQSVITQSVITIAVVGTWLYMQVAQIPCSEVLNNVVGLVVGFFFGGKYAMAVSRYEQYKRENPTNYAG